MITRSINFSDTSYFSKLVLNYQAQEKSVQPFYQYPNTVEAIEQIIFDKQKENIDRVAVSNSIQRQYKSCLGLPQFDVVQQHILSFQSQNSFCIVTAHQLNILGGPLYFIYKIAQTISTCKQLKESYPAYNFIPVYWMGSEDHDFEEINHISVFNKKVEWNDKQGGATGRYTTQRFAAVLEDLKTIVGNDKYTAELMDIFSKAYQQDNLSNATRYLVHALFGKYGLVVIDGDDAELKQQFTTVLQDELLQQHAAQLVNEQIDKLESSGYKQQAFPRPINLFYLGENSRERIEYTADTKRYVVLNTSISFSRDEILQEVLQHPERFSPNVILRPLYQQKVLPALAYIGGGGELSYWLQLKPLFEYYKINFPQLILRNSALLVNAPTQKKIDKLEWMVTDFFQDIEQLKKLFILQKTEDDVDISGYKKEIETTFLKLQDVAKKIDGSLINTVGAELQKTLQNMDAIQKKLIKSVKQKNETELLQIEKIKNQLFPNHSLQERVENFSPYYASYGEAFIQDLINAFDVYQKEFVLITLNSNKQ
ncbi:MAG: bacillithiol biosynthesis cysteine-adding enzyme BshC [Chitinophagales bacterium]